MVTLAACVCVCKQSHSHVSVPKTIHEMSPETREGINMPDI